MARQTVTVPNISCDHCVNTIKRELRRIDGVMSVEVDRDSKRVTIEWEDPPARWEDIRQTLKEINYPAEESSR